MDEVICISYTMIALHNRDSTMHLIASPQIALPGLPAIFGGSSFHGLAYPRVLRPLLIITATSIGQVLFTFPVYNKDFLSQIQLQIGFFSKQSISAFKCIENICGDRRSSSRAETSVLHPHYESIWGVFIIRKADEPRIRIDSATLGSA